MATDPETLAARMRPDPTAATVPYWLLRPEPFVLDMTFYVPDGPPAVPDPERYSHPAPVEGDDGECE